MMDYSADNEAHTEAADSQEEDLYEVRWNDGDSDSHSGYSTSYVRGSGRCMESLPIYNSLSMDFFELFT